MLNDRTKMGRHWEGKKVLELGSGLGHLGWGLYQMGANITCTDTPFGDLEPLQKRVNTWLEEEVHTCMQACRRALKDTRPQECLCNSSGSLRASL